MQSLDPERQDLLSRIHVHESARYTDQYPDHWGYGMTITMKDGRHYFRHVEDASGSVTSPMAADQLLNKALTCCDMFDEKKTRALFEALRSLETLRTLPGTQLMK